MRVVIYARFSSHSQTEQSIEGQLKVCHEYAEANGHIVIDEYIDRAQSGTTDNRTEFQRMIADSSKHTFDAVLMYQLDRFARNRYDSAINKEKLRKNGVRVISARENITDDASGVLIEGVLESMAEYYSAELSQKIRRGMAINAEKCLSTGSNPGLGFKVDAERRFYIDDEEADIVREIFERYAKGDTVADIARDLNARQIKTSHGKEFNKNSLHRLVGNTSQTQRSHFVCATRFHAFIKPLSLKNDYRALRSTMVFAICLIAYRKVFSFLIYFEMLKNTVFHAKL